MRNDTRAKFAQMLSFMAATYGVPDVSSFFSATPTIEQKLMDKIVESSAFLQAINVIGVDDLEEQKIFGSGTNVLGKRTNTEERDRKTSDPLNLGQDRYKCSKTEYDVHIKYSTVDAWSKFPDFYERFRRYVRKGIALARIKQGFYGEKAADETDSSTYPNGEDVNVGWIQHLRNYNGGSQLFDEGETTDAIRVGGSGDFANLDHFVHEILQLVHPLHRQSGDLVAMIGRDLLAIDKSQLYKAQGQTPTEKERIENSKIIRTYGGLSSYTVDNFPARGLLITSLDNLSLYYQRGAVRQKIEDNAKRDRIEHYNTLNEAYVVEDLDKAAAVEFKNVKIWNGEAFV